MQQVKSIDPNAILAGGGDFAMGYDPAIFGNHEYDYSYTHSIAVSYTDRT